MKKLIASLTILGAIVCQTSFAQTQMSATPDSTTVNFVTNASLSDMKEMTAAKLALKKAKSPSVKAYASKMIMHHSMTSKKMKALVMSKGYQIPPPPAPPLDPSLTAATGTDFDHTYMAMMVSDHQKAVALFTKASTHVADPAFKALAVKTLPMLKEHLTSAQSIAAKMKTTAMATSK